MKRPFAAFLALWFLLVMIEPEAVHSCPVHSATSSQSSHAGHHAASMGHHQSHDASPAKCSCPGDCAATSINALPSAASHLARFAIAEFSAHVPRAASIALEQSDFLLPFAIGPPATVIA